MVSFKHFSYDQCKLILNMLSKEMKCVEMAQLLKVDPTSISKKIINNRT